MIFHPGGVDLGRGGVECGGNREEAISPPVFTACIARSSVSFFQSQLGADGLHGIDHELNVRFQFHPEILSAANDIVAIHSFREALGLHLLQHARCR
jgi:hypothetical protein